jgi:hypothetical protein
MEAVRFPTMLPNIYQFTGRPISEDKYALIPLFKPQKFAIYPTVKKLQKTTGNDVLDNYVTQQDSLFLSHLCFCTSASLLQWSANKPRVNKIIVFYCKKQMGHINIFCGRNIEICHNEPRDTCLVSLVLLRGERYKIRYKTANRDSRTTHP